MYALTNCRIEKINSDTVLIKGNCIVTGKPYEVKTENKCFIDYMNGALLQDAFPNLSIDDREFLKTGYSPEGWNQIFGEENE